MAGSPSAAALLGGALAAPLLAGCETGPQTIAEKIQRRPAPRTEAERAAECAWVRSELAVQRAAEGVGEQMTVSSGLAASAARGAIAELEAYAAGIPCTSNSAEE